MKHFNYTTLCLAQVDEEQTSQKGGTNALLMAWNKSHTDPCGHTNLSGHQTSSKQIKTRCRVIVPSISFVVIYAKHIESPKGAGPSFGSELIWQAKKVNGGGGACEKFLGASSTSSPPSMHRWKKKILTVSTIICPWVFHWLTSPICTFPIPIFSTRHWNMTFDVFIPLPSHPSPLPLLQPINHRRPISPNTLLSPRSRLSGSGNKRLPLNYILLCRQQPVAHKSRIIVAYFSQHPV